MQLSNTLHSHLTSMPDIDLWNPQRLFLNDRNGKVLFHFYHIFCFNLSAGNLFVQTRMYLILVVMSEQRISIIVNEKIVDLKELFHTPKKRFCVATGSSEKC